MVNAQIAATDLPSHRYHCAGEGRWLCSAPFRIFRPASSNTRSARTSQAGRPVGGHGFFILEATAAPVLQRIFRSLAQDVLPTR